MNRLLAAAASGVDPVYLSPPCPPQGIERLDAELFAQCGIRLPPPYATLLAVSDGLQIDNAIFDGSATLVGANHDFHSAAGSHLVLGHSGNVDSYVCDVASGAVLVTNFYDTREVTSRHPTLDALLETLLDGA